jgi:isoaspartyl peptidase/L-asparaginase-like protein (Ntn-hydrolase superfamily)
VTWAILTHGGAASPAAHADGCQSAAERARAILERGGDAVEAALAATVWLEDDERFNAGTGSNLRLDGELVQMDAALMASDGRFGSVACIEAVKNPILVAARVTETPHLMLVGDGATAFARRLGFPAYDPVTERARAKHRRALDELAGRGDGYFADDAAPWSGGVTRFWNFPGDPPPELVGAAPRETAGCDTVGAVVRDPRGLFCATASTGGTVYMLRGRVGDSPILGCGLFAGAAGAVAATGVGEEIARRVLCKTVHDWLAAGASAAEAADRAVALFDERIDVGLLVATPRDQAIRSNRSMAAALLTP